MNSIIIIQIIIGKTLAVSTGTKVVSLAPVVKEEVELSLAA